jgi:hypothetical protein
MFGLYPRQFGVELTADANNLIDIAARCLLIEDGDRLILIDTEWEINQRNFWLLFPVDTFHG